jgi:hypothetical protein
MLLTPHNNDPYFPCSNVAPPFLSCRASLNNASFAWEHSHATTTTIDGVIVTMAYGNLGFKV